MQMQPYTKTALFHILIHILRWVLLGLPVQIVETIWKRTPPVNVATSEFILSILWHVCNIAVGVSTYKLPTDAAQDHPLNTEQVVILWLLHRAYMSSVNNITVVQVFQQYLEYQQFKYN